MKQNKLLLKIRGVLPISHLAIILALFIAAPMVVKFLATRCQCIVLSCFSEDLAVGLLMLLACGIAVGVRMVINRYPKTALGENSKLVVALLLVLIAFMGAINAWTNTSAVLAGTTDAARLDDAERAIQEHDPLCICSRTALDTVKQTFSNDKAAFDTANRMDEALQFFIMIFWTFSSVFAMFAFSLTMEEERTVAVGVPSNISLVVVDDTKASATVENAGVIKDQY